MSADRVLPPIGAKVRMHGSVHSIWTVEDHATAGVGPMALVMPPGASRLLLEGRWVTADEIEEVLP